MAKKGSNFSAFQKKLKNAEESLEKGRKGRRGLIEVEAGNYIARALSLEFGENNGKPYTHLTSIVVEAENDDDVGLKIAERTTFEEKKGVSKKTGKPYHIAEADHFANLCTCLQSFGFDTSEMELSDLPDAADMLADENPACNVKVFEKDGYIKARWGKNVDDDELPAIGDVLEDEDDEEDDDSPLPEDNEDEEGEEENDDDNDGDNEEEDEEEFVPSKGETVSAKPAKAKKYEDYTVKSSNKGKKTCTLVRDRDEREFKLVPFALINEIDEEDEEE